MDAGHDWSCSLIVWLAWKAVNFNAIEVDGLACVIYHNFKHLIIALVTTPCSHFGREHGWLTDHDVLCPVERHELMCDLIAGSTLEIIENYCKFIKKILNKNGSITINTYRRDSSKIVKNDDLLKIFNLPFNHHEYKDICLGNFNDLYYFF